MAEPAAGLPPCQPALPDYLQDFIGQFLADPQRVNPEMTFEFLRDFYIWAAKEFTGSREYCESQVRQIVSWRTALKSGPSQ